MDYALAKALRGGVERRIRALETRCVFPASEFPWSAQVERRYPGIRRECDAVLAQLAGVTNFDDVLPGLPHGDDWKSFYLVATRQDVPQHQALCPETTAALREIPGLLNAFFSIFRPGVHTRPHRGAYAGVLRYHLGIRVPDGDVGIRVADQQLRWDEGRSLIFDDRFEHEAWNHTDDLRVVLFVDFERPLPWALSRVNKGMLLVFEYSALARGAKRFILENQLPGPGG